MSGRRGELRALLEAHRSLDERERGHCDRMLRLLEVEGDPFDRNHFDPGHFTASAFVLSPERDALLMILHGRLNRWLQPGGHVEPDDPDLAAGARREVEEETGLRLSGADPGTLFDVDVHPIPARRAEPAHEHFDLRFLAVAPHRRIAAVEEVRDARWVPLEEVAARESDLSVLRAVEKIRAL